MTRRSSFPYTQAGLLASFTAFMPAVFPAAGSHTLPGLPVFLYGAQVHSDGIAPDSHRLPFSPAHDRGHLWDSNADIL